MSPDKYYVFDINYHLVIKTKNSLKCLNEVMQQELEVIIMDFCRNAQVEARSIKITANYFEIALATNTNFTASKFVNSLKTVSSRLLRKSHGEILNEYYAKTGLWERGYLFVSKAPDRVEIIIDEYLSR